MPGTASAKTNQTSPAAAPLPTFSSPMLAATDRLLAQVSQRLAGPEARFSGRSLAFADRILARRGAVFSDGADGAGGDEPGASGGLSPRLAPLSAPTARSLDAQGWVFSSGWLPSPASLAQARAERGRGQAMPVVTPPAAKTARAATPAVKTAPVAGAPAPVAGTPAPVAAVPTSVAAPLTAAAPVAASSSAVEAAAPAAFRAPSKPPLPLTAAVDGRPGEIAAPAVAGAPSLPVEAAALSLAAAPSPSSVLEDSVAAPAEPVAAPAGITSAAVAAPPESRVRDALALTAPVRRAPAALPSLARSFRHLAWADVRLGRAPEPIGLADAAAPSPGFALSSGADPALAALRAPSPEAAVRQPAGAPPSLTMVNPVDLVARRPVEARREAVRAGSSVASAPARRPDAAPAQPAPAVAPASLPFTPEVRPGAAVPQVREAPAALAAPTGAPASAAEFTPAAPRFDAGLRPGALDPGLFASSAPALGRAPRSLSLAELFLEGATAPAALSSSPVAAAARPWQAPGGLASRTERLASTTFAQSASGSVGPSVFGAASAWQAAPGVPAALRQVLASAEAPSLRSAWSGPLPFLPSPRLETVRPGAASGSVAAAAGTAAPAGVRRAAAAPRAVSASTPLVAPSVAPSVAAAPPVASVPGLSAPAAAPAPWRQPGGAATLAELFAAGIGLGSGAASSAAIRTLAAGPLSLLPPWLAPSTVAEDAASAGRVPGAALEFVRRERAEQPAVATARSAGPDARAAVRPPSPVRAPQLGLGAPSFQQVGGLAAQTEAFASQRGLPGSPVGVSTAAAPESGAWRPISGGMVYVPAPSAEPAARAARAGQAAPPVSRALPRAAGASPSLLPGVAPVAGGARPAGAFQSLGGVGLRSELFAADVAPVVAAPQSGTAPAERSTWASAPGVPSAVARALLRAEPAAAATLPRWTLGDAGLMYLSAPQAAATARAGRPGLAPPAPSAASAAAALAVPAARAAAPSPLAAPSPPGAPAAAFESPSAQPASLAGAAAPSAEARAPWQRAGGLATLAELFAAGVGLGSASASGLAQQAGVAASGGLLPAWLGPFAQASGAEPASALPSEARERAEARGARPRLLYLGRDERSRADATVASGERAALPYRRPAPAPLGAAARAAEAASGVSAPAPSASVAAGFWQQAGGLAARAEAFVHDRSSAGLVDSLATPGTAPAAEQRSLPVAGGLVYLPAARRPLASETAQTAPAAPGLVTAPAAAAAASRWAAPPSQPAYARAGGLGLASELFSAGVAPSMLASTGPDGAPASPWAGVVSLPMVSAAAAPRRQAAGSSLSLPLPTAGTAAPSPAVRAPAGAPAAAPSVVPGLARGWQAPGALASLAERFSAATADRGGAEAGVSVGAAPANLWPVLSLGADPLTGQRSTGARAGGRSDLERRYADRMLTSFPRVAAPTADASAPVAQPAQLLPQTTQRAAQLERLSQLLAMLPTDFRPTAALQQAAESSGVAGLPLWQRMPAPLASVSPSGQAGASGRAVPAGLGAPLLAGDPGELDEEGLDPDEAFHTPLGGRPALTLVSSVGYEHGVQRPGAARSAPASGTRQAVPPAPASAPAWQRQAPAATLVTQVMQAAVAGNKPAEASLRLMEAIRSHASGEVARSDDRISLGDLTMIAISMGDRRIAAASQGVSAPSVPHVETALRQFDHPNQPEDNKSRDDKIDRMAKAVKKFMQQDEFRDGMRGAANSSGTS